ncbi:hypothetical protein [Hymenobacter cellulosivorans]|uniref:Lipoprotein n=1 Tax=Hymenobacter cellulosivorans TaxID=2932249 RepID=A0ABY4F9S9_9BACT|nr:hypothetical protein [Hymenobacter cellulosivorans]UOQ52709.1 hypothetical protein MUN80_23550 [Hymenobacter cellulosivorans]
MRKYSPNYVLIVGVGIGLLSLSACQPVGNDAKTEAIKPRPGKGIEPTASAPASVASAAATPADSVRELARFTPAGYRVEAVSQGDLNRDAFPDQVVVLRLLAADSSMMGDETARPLLLLLGSASGRYTLAARNDQVVLCTGCGGMMGDPFQGITIKNGYFSLEYYGGSAWRWTHVTTFKYDPTGHSWFLHREGGESFHATDPDKVESYSRTTRDFGRVAFTKYDHAKEFGQ